MADIQDQIVQFDEKIRLTWNNEEKTLREKRDIILDKLRAKFAELRKEGKDIPSFQEFNQGSYKMGTGIQPADGDYDIDVGLKFNCASTKYPNPVDLKVLVAKVLDGHTHLGTEVHRSCVRVKYQVDGEQAYHVDLALYTCDDPKSSNPKLFIAKGKVGAAEADRKWEPSDPQGLTAWVEGRFPDPHEETQFLRVIRLMKRWKTKKFQADSQNAPSGIGLTVAAGQQGFQPQLRRAPSGALLFDDLKAMRLFVEAMLARFQGAWKSDGTRIYRLSVQIPVEPWTDIFARMSDGQMTKFHERLTQLKERLNEVTLEPDPVKACKLMREDFGDEFPVPEKSSTASTSATRAIVSPAVSA